VALSTEPAASPARPTTTPVDQAAPWTLLIIGGLAVLACAVLGVNRAILAATVGVNLVFLIFFLRHVAFAAAAMRWAPRDLYEAPEVELGYQPAVSVLVACHDEALVAEKLVTGMAALHYPRSHLEILFVDDGSTDGTGDLLERLTAGERHMHVLRRPPGSGGGKSGALNLAAERARGEVLVVFDADHVPRRDVIARLVRHFQDDRVDAVQGRCIIRNSVESTLARSIAIDYFSGYLVNEYGRQALFGMPAYGGANCAVRTSRLRELGGWNEDSVTEDTDLTMRIVLSGGKIRYDITAVDTEEGATTLRRFRTQRYRWARGHQQVWREYRAAVVRSPHLTFAEKVETLLFLLVYHVPAVCALTLFITALRIAGVGPSVSVFEMLPLSALLFAGPFCELAVGLVVGRAPRRAAWSVAWLTPLFFVFMLVCAKAWLDGVLGRPYTWAKTKRSSWSPLHGVST
jgi:cellulose synthase/poly-beta-1,6-N-acetylglucosamine synthase-like glycosyltransferase